MSSVTSIAFNTFRESIREKLLYISILFGGILLVSNFVLSPLAVGAKNKIVLDVGLAAISILGVVSAVLIGSSLVHKEVDKRAVFMVLTRPVPRSLYLIGKFAGIVTAILLMVAVMSGIMLVTVAMSGFGITPVLIAAVYSTALEIMIMCAVVILFSTFTTSLLTTFFSLCFFVAGTLCNDLRIFAQKFGGVFIKYTVEVFYYLLPNLKVFNLRHEAVHGLGFRGSDLIFSTIYAFVYCGVVLYFAYLIFRRREFS